MPLIWAMAPIHRLLMLLQVQSLFMGPCTDSHCCCLHRHTLPYWGHFQVSSLLLVC
ncbi:unnamed protein product [Staurois parvus]|uniref:Uncharacterized protein n=1 Tax=Staurois parvus TaxID=386267 RepID=A0ABN9GQL0_9NEOB|nr:unnamed protein product [Staurois parvus]